MPDITQWSEGAQLAVYAIGGTVWLLIAVIAALVVTLKSPKR